MGRKLKRPPMDKWAKGLTTWREDLDKGDDLLIALVQRERDLAAARATAGPQADLHERFPALKARAEGR